MGNVHAIFNGPLIKGGLEHAPEGTCNKVNKEVQRESCTNATQAQCKKVVDTVTEKLCKYVSEETCNGVAQCTPKQYIEKQQCIATQE